MLGKIGASSFDVQAIETTINKKLQREIDRQIKIVSTDNKIKNVAAVILCNYTGNILAESSWTNGSETEFSPTFDGKIQPGSTFKTFALISALEQGFPLEMEFESAPFKSTSSSQSGYGTPWTVRNYQDRYFGYTSVENALVRSDNSVFARLAQTLDLVKLSETYSRFKLIIDEPVTPSTVLGGIRDGTSLLAIAAAYSAIARNGVYITPRLIKFIQFRDGTFNYVPQSLGHNVINHEVCAQIKRILQRSGVVLSNRLIAGKSGTTKTGSLFAGYDKNVSLAVWVDFRETPNEYDEKAVTAKRTIERIGDALLGYKHPRLLEII
jgi:membrane peptidoglycan carboxypeptidase